MTENMKKWLELVSADEALRKELEEINVLPREEAYEKLIGKAAERGFVLTEEDFGNPASKELSDDELDAVAAGGGCGCPGFGGGEGPDHSGITYNCICMIIGIGDRECRDNPGVNCVCTGVGAGVDG